MVPNLGIARCADKGHCCSLLLQHHSTSLCGVPTTVAAAVSEGYKELAKEPYGILGKYVKILQAIPPKIIWLG